MEIILISFAVFALVMLLMAVGFIIRGKCLRGSCGGPSVLSADGAELTCGSCGKTKKVQLEQEEEKQ